MLIAVNMTKIHFALCSFDTPIEFRAGDELRVNCTYQTLGKNITTNWGEATSDEMCFGFITIYPALKGFNFCSLWKDLPMCPLSDAVSYPNCDVATFQSFFAPIGQYCAAAPNCSMLCQSLVAGMLSTKCLQGTLGEWIRTFYPQRNSMMQGIFNVVSRCQASMPTFSPAPVRVTAIPVANGPGSGRGATSGQVSGLRNIGQCHHLMLLVTFLMFSFMLNDCSHVSV